MISEVRIAKINGEFKINPTRQEMENAEMDFIIAATEKNIMMVEGEAKQCQESEVIDAIEKAHVAINTQIQAQKELWEMVGSPVKREVAAPYANEEIKNRILTNLPDVFNYASIHIRRGDYLQFPNHHPQQSVEYYKKASEIIGLDYHKFLTAEKIRMGRPVRLTLLQKSGTEINVEVLINKIGIDGVKNNLFYISDITEILLFNC